MVGKQFVCRQSRGVICNSNSAILCNLAGSLSPFCSLRRTLRLSLANAQAQSIAGPSQFGLGVSNNNEKKGKTIGTTAIGQAAKHPNTSSMVMTCSSSGQIGETPYPSCEAG
jgi:hypothetical protein